MAEETVLQSRKIAGYGWKPSLPDARDIVADASGLPVAAQVDPRHELPPVFDQGNLGSCTANAVAAAIEYDALLSGHDFGACSRLDIYYGERAIEGALSQGDTGAYGRDGFKYAHRVGVIPEEDWPYDIARFEDKPPADVPHRHKIGQYRAVPRRLLDFKRVLSNRQTIAFGFTVYDSFESQDVADHGVVPMPDVHSERQLGGHEVLAVGYLSGYPDHVLVRNSWGADWGLGGYCLMPWHMLLDRSMSSDFRTIARPAGH